MTLVVFLSSHLFTMEELSNISTSGWEKRHQQMRWWRHQYIYSYSCRTNVPGCHCCLQICGVGWTPWRQSYPTQGGAGSGECQVPGLLQERSQILEWWCQGKFKHSYLLYNFENLQTGLSHYVPDMSPKLFHVKGKRKPIVRQLFNISWSEMNRGDSYVIDVPQYRKVLIWRGKNTNRSI